MKTVILVFLFVGCGAFCLWLEFVAQRRLADMARKLEERQS